MLSIKDLSFSYNRGRVIEDIDFDLAAGEHLSIMGESGCGKSTLLKLLYGIHQPESGEIHWKGESVRGPAYKLVPGESYMKYLAQDFDLMPFLSVRENISQYLSVFQPDKLASRTSELMETMEISPLADQKVNTLSGGQQQRVALARVLAQQPEVLLLDEPFSHIDNFKKNQLRRQLFSFLKQEGISCICATHDAMDVLPYADRVLVLKEGKIMDDRPTQQIYDHPQTMYVASLFGEANQIPINVLKSYADTKRQIIVYAHELRVSEQNGLKTTVNKSYPMGVHYLHEGITEEGQTVRFYHPQPIETDKDVFLNISLGTINKRMIH